MTAIYHFSPHTFACLSGRHCMFLDMTRDAYFSVSRQAMEELAPFVAGWQLVPCDPPAAEGPPSAAATALASELLAAGVLREGYPASQVSRRVASAVNCELTSTTAPGSATGGSFRPFVLTIAALLYADWMMHTTSVAHIVGAIRDRKRSHMNCGHPDSDKTTRLTLSFLEYRPYFPRNYRCLFDSLALIYFLSWFNVFPDLTFGVQDEPFSAHCWVQAGPRVLNDHLDHVTCYTPIMSV